MVIVLLLYLLNGTIRNKTMDKIDELIEQAGDAYINNKPWWCIVLDVEKENYMTGIGNKETFGDRFICTVGEYKERLHKQQLIKLIESACTDDAASIANVIIRNGWVKK